MLSVLSGQFSGMSGATPVVLFGSIPPIRTSSALVVVEVALLATWAAARRAMRLDPATALHYE